MIVAGVGGRSCWLLLSDFFSGPLLFGLWLGVVVFFFEKNDKKKKIYPFQSPVNCSGSSLKVVPPTYWKSRLLY